MSESNKNNRINNIRHILLENNSIHLRDAAKALKVSEMTLRRDLAGSENEIQILGGYITRAPGASGYYVSSQSQQRIAEKRRIGKIAASFIENHDTVFFDCGTTTPFVVDFIPDHLEFTAICNSLNLVLSLQRKPNCTIILCGGRLHRRNQVFESLEEIGVLNGLRIGKAFVSAAGIDAQCGVTCFNMEEVPVKKRVIAQAQRRFLLADHSKFGIVRAAHFADLREFHYVISDEALPDHYRTLLEKENTELLI
ncbi:DNA-binding transcriptional repressor DeoR [Kozakia baliensis]|uniref:DNA-binding transcriptional repressor DeoR n=1 Tax=Kozakia baliensis TaxID=153496 RepID=UPI0004980879|nr:DNA-binding transcriptional repressor DeoR [Kozakia baliensis]